MLQRAASNAYSWWWASNIRTGQSKWLDNSLQDMEEKVKSMIKLIEEDGDSFAKKAEMYFQRRPVLVKFVEEAYREYKALADRYDHISKELHKANHTIATAFPDQLQHMHDEEEDGSPKAMVIDPSKLIKPSSIIQRISAVNKYKKNQSSSKKPQPNFSASPVDKDTAQEEIDRLQKEILVLQTEKEFVKGTYENGLAKYVDIEKQITEMQEEVSCLQDEFSVSVVIGDDEARALMAATALKSCEETLVSLQAQQKRSIKEAQIESQRIRKAKRKLKVLKSEYGQPHVDTGDIDKSEGNSSLAEEDEVVSLNQERLELNSMCEKVKEHFETSSDTSVVELAEKIDELVDKVISLEFTVSSQNALITRLRSQTDELQKHLHVLEEDKAVLTDDSNMLSGRLKQAEDELDRVQDLEKSVQDEKGMLQSHFTEACHSLNDLSEKLQSPRHQDQINVETSSQERKDERIQSSTDNLINGEPLHSHSEAVMKQENGVEQQLLHAHSEAAMKQENGVEQQLLHAHSEAAAKQEDGVEEQPLYAHSEEAAKKEDGVKEQPLHAHSEAAAKKEDGVKEQLLFNETNSKEKILLEEYTSMLENYRDAKKRLSEVEKKNQDCVFGMISEIRELKSANARMDEELQSIRQKLGSSETTPLEDADSSSTKRPTRRSLRSKSLYSIMTADRYRESNRLDATFFTNTDSPLMEDISLQSLIEEPHTSFDFEEKFRRDIDSLLEDNLDFWLKFCTSYHQIQKFKMAFEELEAEVEMLKDNKTQEGSADAVEKVAKQGSEPTDKKLRELNTELQVWLEQNALLKGELKSRSLSLSIIEEDISRALKASETERMKFTPYQAAKFQGEVINMQQENNKVVNELQTGMDHVRELQIEVSRVLSKLHESFELKSHHHSDQLRHLSSKGRVPLRTFLFGTKPKKPSIFSCMNPAMRKHYNNMRHGIMK